VNKLLILLLLSFSFIAIGKEDPYNCKKKNGRMVYRSKLCKTGSKPISTDLINVNKSKKRYSGKHINLETLNTRANFAFRKLADFSGYSLLMDANINREISFNSAKAPWDLALDKLAESLGLKAKIFNRIIYVDTPASLKKYKPRKKRYHGSILSLDFHEIEASHLFNVLADFSGNSLLIDANIDREITIKRHDIPWNQILDEVAEFLNLKAIVSSGIIYVDTPISLWKYKHTKKNFDGSPVSLNFLSISVSELFKILAEFSGNSFVIGPNINKKINSEISIKRNNIPWDQALNEITEFLNLKYNISNGVVYVEEKKIRVIDKRFIK